MADLQNALDAMIPEDSGCVAVRVHGLFERVEARAIQSVSKPYPPPTFSSHSIGVFTRQCEGLVARIQVSRRRSGAERAL